MPYNEKELIIQCQTGDTEAFGRLYDIHIKTIYNFIFYKTFDKEVAQDLTSDTFFKTLKNIASVDPDRPFISWLYKIAQNTVLDYYRARRFNEDIDDFWDLSEDNGLEMLEASDLAIHVTTLREHLKKLSSVERDVIIMRVWQDIPYKTIADIVGKSEASCKMIYSRSLVKLRNLMPLTLLILFFIR
jgi:RNA polymerase sigma-70 factor (ECF subfamily)